MVREDVTDRVILSICRPLCPAASRESTLRRGATRTRASVEVPGSTPECTSTGTSARNPGAEDGAEVKLTRGRFDTRGGTDGALEERGGERTEWVDKSPEGRLRLDGALATMFEAEDASGEAVEKEEGPTDTSRSMRGEETEAASSGN